MTPSSTLKSNLPSWGSIWFQETPARTVLSLACDELRPYRLHVLEAGGAAVAQFSRQRQERLAVDDQLGGRALLPQVRDIGSSGGWDWSALAQTRDEGERAHESAAKQNSSFMMISFAFSKLLVPERASSCGPEFPFWTSCSVYIQPPPDLEGPLASPRPVCLCHNTHQSEVVHAASTLVRGISLAMAAILLLPVFGQIASTSSACKELGRSSSDACKAAQDLARPVAVGGRVMLEEGTPPPALVVIERVCNGASHSEGYTDREGRFSIRLGQTAQAVADASQRAGAGAGDMASMAEAGVGPNLGTRFANCVLRARLSGYRSQTVSLLGHDAMASPDVGVILLHRLVKGEEPTVSATTLKASKPARKAFQKGMDLAKKKDFDEAMDSLREAVKLDPDFALAWRELGKLQVAHDHVDEGRQSFEAAARSEPHWPDPLLELSLLDLRAGDWKDLADVTDQVLRLNSFDYPEAFFYNAVANYNLRLLPAAEKSVRSAQKLDTPCQYPQIARLLGDILALERQMPGPPTGSASTLRWRSASCRTLPPCVRNWKMWRSWLSRPPSRRAGFPR